MPLPDEVEESVGQLSEEVGAEAAGPSSWLLGDAVPASRLPGCAVDLGGTKSNSEDVLVIAVVLLFKEGDLRLEFQTK